MRVKLQEGGKLLLEGEVCVRTDLVRSVTTGLTKQRSGRAELAALPQQCSSKLYNRKQTAVRFHSPATAAFSR